MALHLFSTPVQCTNCGAVVDDPTLDRCPTCGHILKERRAPRRLAGVEERYGSLRMLMGVTRFLAAIVLLLGGLLFFSTLGEEGLAPTTGTAVMLGSVVVCVALLSLAGFFSLAMDLEENSRSSFRVQQLILEELQEARHVAERAAAGATAAATEEPAPESATPAPQA